MGYVQMSQKEVKRLAIVMKAVDGEIKQREGAERIEVSYRQFKRQVKRVREEGEKGICHRNRGKVSPKKMSVEMRKEIVRVYKDRYADFGPTLGSEKLLEREKIMISRESLRKLLIQEGIWRSRRKRDRKLHVWRQRRDCEGELVQMDGSHHRWLEGRLDLEFCLMAYIDDATSTVYARFYEYEGVYPVFDSFKRFINRFGRPGEVYTDRHSTYKTTKKASIEDELEDREPLTQFQRVMGLLDIKVIFAQSPQAKGRVERLFQTLQDRLVKEMRLAGIDSINAANDFLEIFLPKYNEHFCVPAKNPEKRWRAPESGFDEQWTFSVRAERTILKNYTIQFRNRLFLIKSPSLALQGQKVEILQTLEGELRFSTQHKGLMVEEISELEPKLKKQKKQTMMQALKKLRDMTRTEDSGKNTWMDEVHFDQNLTLQPISTVPYFVTPTDRVQHEEKQLVAA
jgi:transposase